MNKSIEVSDDIFNEFYNIFGSQPFFNPISNDYNPAQMPGFIISYEEICMIDDDTELPGREMALHLASPNLDGDTFWNTETDEYITKFKELSNVVEYSLQPIIMLVCNVETKTFDTIAPPRAYPVTFRVNKRIDNEYVLVKYLQYTENGSMLHYSPKESL
jgi:hypothetical protein